ncbi:hypothetical protein EBQ26_06185 [Allofranklinella schreckenbergeri]|uniref:Uncharacterized protein n=1 Tax=Allofranklinella schreckenbergeri TaxID=1076744 RepID=A0A3M6Q6Z3_9BURK|nr:DUF6364 family protein [Allofranklinella schreckenbergeri]RMW98889.1 hypothetical protein EBQ26_06185 [Allofranklinella schreckenbergeri]
MQTQLTLWLDTELLRQVEAYAEREGQSVAALVEDYFAQLAQLPAPGASSASLDTPAKPVAPVTARLLGALHDGLQEDGKSAWRQHVQQKHGRN